MAPGINFLQCRMQIFYLRWCHRACDSLPYSVYSVAVIYSHEELSRTGPGRRQREEITLIQLMKKFPDEATAEAWFADARWLKGII